jgi:tetratricopeptide (TPR) repeat protein
MRAFLRFRNAGRIALVGLLLLLVGFGLWLVSRHLLANYHMGQAAKALERQRYPRALEEYQEALRYRPASATLHLLAGRTARRAGDIPTAREHLRRCRELQKGVSEELQLEEYLVRAQTGEVDEVYRYLQPYLFNEGPLTPLVLEALVRAYMGKYRTDLAGQCLSGWLQLEPDNVEALFRQGTWCAQQQNIRGAASDYARALDLDPLRTDVRLAYAQLFRADRMFEQAAEQYRTVLQQSPRDPAALLGLAQCDADLGKPEEAREPLEALPEEQQDTADVLAVRGMVEMRCGQPEKAEPLLRRALVRDPGQLDACYNLMLCLKRLGREDESRAMNARFQQIEADQKRLIAIASRELSASPSSADLHCELGEIYLRLGRPEKGVHWLLAALRLDPGHRRTHERLRDYYDGLGPEGKERADFHRRQLAAR